MKKAYIVLAMSIVAVGLSVPLMAQSIRLVGNIPFEFTVNGKTMPAGEYTISNGTASFVIHLQGEENRAGALALARQEHVGLSSHPENITMLEFNKYGNRYFLSKVIDGYAGAGFAVRMTKAERELAKTASAERFEVLATLASR